VLIGSRSTMKDKEKRIFSWPIFWSANFWKLANYSGCNFTLPALHTPWTLLKAAAMVNFSEMGESPYHVLHTTRTAKLGRASRLARATDPVNMLDLCAHMHLSSITTGTSTTRHDAESEEHPPAPHCLDSAARHVTINHDAKPKIL